MRRTLILTTVAALGLALAAPAPGASAAARVAGSKTLELGHGHGRAIIAGRGAVLGNLTGRIRVVHLPRGEAPEGWVHGCRARSGSFAGRFTCRGSGLRFFVYGGTWRIHLGGRRINVSGRIRGKLGLDRRERGSPWYTIGSADRRAWPATLTFYAVRS